MKKQIITCVILVVCLGMSLSALELVFKSGGYSFQTIRALGYAVSGGADVGEVLKTAYAITEGDDESWCREWQKTATHCEQVGNEFLELGHKPSARQQFLKASNYFRTAEFFLHDNPDDPRIISLWQKSRDNFLRAARLMDGPVEAVKIPFEGTFLPGYLCLVDGSGKPRPLLIVHSGFDGTKEELYLEVGFFALQRGYNVLLFEGPGQGEVIRVQKLPFRPNWETVVTPVVDFALTRKEVDPKKIALMGISFGGYLAPRAAAFEKRLAACIANGGVYDFHMTMPIPAEEMQALDSPEGCKELDKAVYARMKTDPTTRYFMGNGMFTFQASSPSAWLKMTRDYTMKDLVDNITCPVLVVDSEEDAYMKGQAKLLFDALKTKKDYLLFTREDGAQEHCQMGAMSISNARILGWLDTILQKGR